MKDVVSVLVLLILVIGSFLYGFLLHRNRIFPYKIVKNIFHKMVMRSSSDYGWAIGTVTCTSPFSSVDLINIKYPSLTGKDVTDKVAMSVADPFILESSPPYHMFFEVVTKPVSRGVIGLAESENGSDWKYKQVVIEEPFHLSYPYVFQWKNEFFLVPESSADLSVRIYKASNFPNRWEYQGNLLKGYHFTDPSLVRYQDTWWMFVSTRENDMLNLYYSDDLMGTWIQHPQSPIVKNNRHHSRPAGRLSVVDGKLYRFAQDDQPVYGSRVFAFEIGEINRKSYREKLAFNEPIVKSSKSGWNSDRMHHIDPHYLADDAWLVAVDGYREPRLMGKFMDQGSHK